MGLRARPSQRRHHLDRQQMRQGRRRLFPQGPLHRQRRHPRHLHQESSSSSCPSPAAKKTLLATYATMEQARADRLRHHRPPHHPLHPRVPRPDHHQLRRGLRPRRPPPRSPPPSSSWKPTATPPSSPRKPKSWPRLAREQGAIDVRAAADEKEALQLATARPLRLLRRRPRRPHHHSRGRHRPPQRTRRHGPFHPGPRPAPPAPHRHLRPHGRRQPPPHLPHQRKGRRRNAPRRARLPGNRHRNRPPRRHHHRRARRRPRQEKVPPRSPSAASTSSS